jgi:hypothetical protein
VQLQIVELVAQKMMFNISSSQTNFVNSIANDFKGKLKFTAKVQVGYVSKTFIKIMKP